jgi:hypothetical protein
VAIDYIYFLFSCVAGVWQAWCLNYGADNTLSIILGVTMGLPFAVLSYAHASILSKSSAIDQRPDWKGMLILWIGMPLSIVMGVLTILATTLFLHAAGYGTDDLPFYSLRLSIGEAAACLAWATCLLMSFSSCGASRSRYYLFVFFATLYAGSLVVHGFSAVVPKYSSKHLLVTSVVETALSARIGIFARGRERRAYI